MNGTEGVVSARTLAEAGVRLAGALAELGETVIEVHRAGETARRLEARRADLPGEIVALAGAGGGTLSCGTLGATIVVGADRVRWQAEDPATGRRLSAALRA
ncbi:MAG: hypothetical protein ACKVU4_13065 [Phycisphaerales bacterium]